MLKRANTSLALKSWLPALVLAAIASVVLPACGSSAKSQPAAASSSSSGGSSKHVNIAMFLVATANTHQHAALLGAEKAVQEDGNASLHAYDGNFQPATQTNQIEDATSGGQYNAFIVDSIDGTQTIPPITKALAADIKVICGFSICGPNQSEFAKEMPVTAQIAANYFTVGKAAGEAMVKGCAGKNPCNVVYLDGTPTLALDPVFKAGVQAAFKQAPNIKIVASAEGQFLAGPAYTAMKTIIQAHPDIDGVVSVGDQEIEGALKAINQSSLSGKKIILVGDGASVIGTAGVKSGQWYASSLLRPYTEGYLSAKYAIAAVRGKPMSPALVNSAVDPKIPDGYIDSSNVASWKPEWAG